jgi:hypothetical protein
MAKKPLNPDSVKGGGMPAMGRSSQGASAAANKRAGAGAAAKKAQASTKVKVTRGFGTINKKGFEKLQKMQEPGVRFYTAAQRGIKPQSSEYVITPTGKRVRKTDLVRSSMLNDYLGFRNTKPRGR